MKATQTHQTFVESNVALVVQGLFPSTVVDSVIRNATQTSVSYNVQMTLPTIFGEGDKEQLLSICSEYAGLHIELNVDMTFVKQITGDLLEGLLEVQDQLSASGGALHLTKFNGSSTSGLTSATFAHLFLN